MKKYFTIFALGMMALSTAAFAATTATGTNTVSPTLQISATVQSAVQLTLSTGTSTAAHCVVTPTPGGGTDYTMTFGTVDALALSTPTCGNKFAPTTPGSTAAVYWSDYNLTPVWTSQATNNATVTARVSADFSSATRSLTVVRDSAGTGAVPAGVTDFTPITTAATGDTIVTTTNSGTAQTRFIGVQVAPTSGTGIPATAQTATVTFTLTVN